MEVLKFANHVRNENKYVGDSGTESWIILV